MQLRILSGQDVRRALPMRDAIEAMRGAFASLGAGSVRMPPRVVVPLHGASDLGLVMPAYEAAADTFAIKVVTVHGENGRRDLPVVQGLVLAIDGATGRPRGLLEASVLTGIRTAAVSALATDLMARRDAVRLAILGSGVQARSHLEALRLVRDLSDVRVHSPDAARRRRFATETDTRAVESSREAVAGADVVCCATSSPTPVFADKDVRPGTHVVAVGAFRPDTHEVPPATVARARRVVDQADAALAEAGDIVIPLRQGLLGDVPFHATLADLVRGTAPGRTADDEVTLFKSVGLAVEDAAAAQVALDRAQRLGIGHLVDL